LGLPDLTCVVPDTSDASPVPRETTVGLVANPASGRDIRRIVTGASVSDNSEKARIILRLLAGLGGAGVSRVLMMPAGGGIGARLERDLDGRTGELARQPMPALEILDVPLQGSAADTTVAVRKMVRRRVGAIVVLGGDGTHREVAKECGDIPICALSTGTNNVFPGRHEATIAGLATGFVAGGHRGTGWLRREKVVHVAVNASDDTDLAVVDVAATTSLFAGAGAFWQPESIREFVVTFANPSAIGLAGVAGLLEVVDRSAPYGLYVRLSDRNQASSVVRAALAPGLVANVPIAHHRQVPLDETTVLECASGSIALDGERAIEVSAAASVETQVTLGPLTIDVDRVMTDVAQRGMLEKDLNEPWRDQLTLKEAVGWTGWRMTV
jgi:predicted polyphosphate/ATP-dependent NAD kinase